jgi:hypothetical protein
MPVLALCGRDDVHEVIRITVGDLDKRAVMRKLKCEIIP